jgi:hypothetical protein
MTIEPRNHSHHGRAPSPERWWRLAGLLGLGWFVLFGHLERALKVDIAHDNAHRPHRALHREPPDPAAAATLISGLP